MADRKISRPVYAFVALVSLAATIGFLMFNPSWFWVFLPFFLTSTVYALDVV